MTEKSSTTRKPTDSQRSVVFRGDGEPRIPRDVIRRLVEFEERCGIETDRYSLGGTLGKLEEKFARILGKEAAVFVPTGTLANHLAIRKHCGLNPRVVLQEQSHLFNDTGDCASRLSGISLIPLAKGRPYYTLEELKAAMGLTNEGRVANPIGAVMIESPVRRQRGQVAPFEVMEEITAYCREQGIPTHLDGARLYMMSAATGVKPREYADKFDTVYISLYKYLGSTFGAILAGSSDLIDGIYHDRRMFGGGLASVYMQASLALIGSEGFEERFNDAIAKAADLFPSINDLDGIEVGQFKHGSNIFPAELGVEVDIERFTSALQRHWVFVYDEGDPKRFHLTVNTTLLRQSNDELVEAFRNALKGDR